MDMCCIEKVHNQLLDGKFPLGTLATALACGVLWATADECRDWAEQKGTGAGGSVVGDGELF